MKVTKIETTVLRVPFGRDYWGSDAWKRDYVVQRRDGRDIDEVYPIRWRMRHRWDEAVTTVLVRVHTDAGLVGLGESKGVVAPHAVKRYIDDYLASWLLGEDPRAVRVLSDRYRAAMRGRGHLQGLHQEAAAGLDIACWDIVGKAAGCSVSTALGGRYRDEIPVYYSSLAGVRDARDDQQLADLAASARLAKEAGHTAVKIGIGFGKRADLASVDTVREVFGEQTPILVDALGAYEYSQALALCGAFYDAGVAWFETPLPTDDLRGYVELSRRSPVPIANDLLWTVSLLKDMFADGVRMVCIPETIKAGITECMRIAELADTYGCGFAPHCSIGSAIQYAANMHVAACAPNLLIAELWENDNPLRRDLVHPNCEATEGHVAVPDEPGLGVTLDEKVLDAVVWKEPAVWTEPAAGRPA